MMAKHFLKNGYPTPSARVQPGEKPSKSKRMAARSRFLATAIVCLGVATLILTIWPHCHSRRRRGKYDFLLAASFRNASTPVCKPFIMDPMDPSIKRFFRILQDFALPTCRPRNHLVQTNGRYGLRISYSFA